MNINEKCTIIDVSIENEFAPLEWFDQTIDKENNTYSITFVGPTYSECCNDDGTFNNIKMLALQDGFFWKMHNIKRMLHNCGYENVKLIKTEMNKENLCSEATIEIQLK